MLGGARSAVSDGAFSDAPTGTLQLPTPSFDPAQFPTGNWVAGTIGSWEFSFSDPCAFRIFQRQLQFARERVDGRTGTLPGAVGLEPQIPDPPSPRRDDPADRPEIGPIRMLLIQPPDHIRGDANEGAQRGRRLDA